MTHRSRTGPARDRQLHLAVSSEELDLADQLAAKSGLSRADVVRALIRLGSEIDLRRVLGGT